MVTVSKHSESGVTVTLHLSRRHVQGVRGIPGSAREDSDYSDTTVSGSAHQRLYPRIAIFCLEDERTRLLRCRRLGFYLEHLAVTTQHCTAHHWPAHGMSEILSPRLAPPSTATHCHPAVAPPQHPERRTNPAPPNSRTAEPHVYPWRPHRAAPRESPRPIHRPAARPWAHQPCGSCTAGADRNDAREGGTCKEPVAVRATRARALAGSVAMRAHRAHGAIRFVARQVALLQHKPALVGRARIHDARLSTTSDLRAT